MTLSEYMTANGTNLHKVAQGAQLSYSHLHRHVHDGHPLGLDVAKRLEVWSGGKLNAAELLGLKVRRAAKPAGSVRKVRA